MKKYLLLLLLKYLLLLLLLYPFLSISQNAKSTTSSKIVIRFQPKVDASQFFQKYTNKRYAKTSVLNYRKVSTIFNIYTVQTSDAAQLMKELKQAKEVLKVGYDIPLKNRNTEPNDIGFSEQWNMLNIQADLVWEETTGGQTTDGKRIVIGVLEKGIDPTHEDLIDNIWTNKAEIPNNNIDEDGNGYVDDYAGLNLVDLTDEHTPTLENGTRENHGTQVAGVIGAKGNNGIGVAGVNWDVDLLLLSKVSSASQVLEAQEYAYHLRKKFNETKGEEGAFIIALNYSFGWDGNYKAFSLGEELCELMELMGTEGILSVVATYNNNQIDVDEFGDVLPSCPSDYVISVTSSNQNNEKTSGAGFGNESIDLAAPGQRVYTLDLDNGYGFVSGTSLACPLVTGTVGLLYSLPCIELGEDAINNPAATAKFIKAAILNGTQPIDGFNGRSLTGGRLDAFAAMQNVQLYCGQPKSNNFEILELYPNPTTSTLTIAFETPNFEPYQFYMTNTLGQIVLRKTVQPSRFEENSLTESVQHFPSGVYFLTLFQEKMAITKRFIVEN